MYHGYEIIIDCDLWCSRSSIEIVASVCISPIQTYFGATHLLACVCMPCIHFLIRVYLPIWLGTRNLKSANCSQREIELCASICGMNLLISTYTLVWFPHNKYRPSSRSRLTAQCAWWNGIMVFFQINSLKINHGEMEDHSRNHN